MVITLSGENSFGWQQELTARVAAFVNEQGDLALERLDGEEADFAHLQAALTSLPFLAPKKLVVLRAPGRNKQFAEKAEELLGQLPEATDVILVEPKLDKRLAYYKLLKRKTDFREFNHLDQAGLARWLVAAAEKRSGSLSSADARYLVERVGANQQLLATELEKLLLYDAHLTRTTIDLMTDTTPQSTIFQLLEAAFAGRAGRALELYAEQRSLKVEPPQIIAMLSWQLHVLALIKTARTRSSEQIAQEAKLNPFVVRKSQAIAHDLTLLRLKALISELMTIEISSKRSGIDVDEALQFFLLTLAVPESD